jgi:hypothetical protein
MMEEKRSAKTSLEERIDSDLKNAIKERNETKISTLRLLKSAIKNACIEKKVKFLKEEDLINVINKQTKQIKESIEAFEKGNRKDLVEKEKKALKILQTYLPEPLAEEDIIQLAKEIIGQVGATKRSDIGKVMKEIMPRLKGRADGKLVNQIVSKLLE